MRIAPAAFLFVSLGCRLLASEPTAGEIIERHVQARGGYDKIKAIRSLIHSGGRYSEGDFVGSGGAFMAFQRPFYRVVGDPRKADFLEGYDGASWEWYADPGVVVRTVGPAAGATRRGADFEGPFVDSQGKGYAIKLGKPTLIDDRPAYELIVTFPDASVRSYFIDKESSMVVADRWSAPIHAFGKAVHTESRLSDFRRVAGVLFPFRAEEREIETGKVLNSMQWSTLEANTVLPRWWFTPPRHELTPIQELLGHLYAERADAAAVMWSYREFRREFPNLDVGHGIEFIGYQMLKMGDVPSAIALLKENAAANPMSSTAAFGLGRAHAAAGDKNAARVELEHALRLNPKNQRAAQTLRSLEE